MVFPEDDELRDLNKWRVNLGDERALWDERTILYVGLWREHNDGPGWLDRYIDHIPNARKGKWWKK